MKNISDSTRDILENGLAELIDKITEFILYTIDYIFKK